MDRGAVRREPVAPARVRPPPPPAAGAGNRPRAQRRPRRRRRDRVPPARGRAPRPVGPQARAVRVEAREPVRRQHRHRVVAAPPRAHEALLQRRRGVRIARRRLAPLPVPRPGADHPVRPRDPRVREVHRPDRPRGDNAAVRAVALIDGEHYVSVVRDALAELPYEVVAAILVGGTEKLRGGEDYGVALRDDFGDAEIVVDLSDEPVLGPAERMRWASRALRAGWPYSAATFGSARPGWDRFAPPPTAVMAPGSASARPLSRAIS